MATNQSGTKTYISDILLSMDSEQISDVQEKTQSILDYARQQGFDVVEGATRNVREREPVESISYAASGIFRNQKAKMEGSQEPQPASA